MRSLKSLLLISVMTIALLDAEEIRINKTSNSSILVRDDVAGIVIDKQSGLIWQDDEAVNSLTTDWEGAKEYCDDLDLADFDDWHLPDIKLLESIVQPKNYPKAIMPSFVNVASDVYWSSSELMSERDSVWNVNFENGSSNGYYKNYKGHVRCIRDGHETD